MRVLAALRQSALNRILEPAVPARANRAERRRCARAGHRWKRFGDRSVRCADCGEVGP